MFVVVVVAAVACREAPGRKLLLASDSSIPIGFVTAASTGAQTKPG